MKFYKRFIRLAAGIISLVILLFLLFAITIPTIHRWGATAAELALQLPGDELTPAPLIRWTHAITIDASPEQVWPWIAQLGDTRGGFYSYTFIENQVGAMMGAGDYQVVYTNANHIYAAWQYPRPGDQIIQDTLKIREVSPDQYFLADSINPEAMNWVWLWYLQPVKDGQQTRMIIRFAIEVPPDAGENPVMGFFMDIGGFVMEQNMIQGIKLRAEGGSEPAWIEPAEIGLWAAALLAGLAAGVLYILKAKWQKPFFVAGAAVIILFILTIVQPALWVRGLLDIGLIAGLVWSGLPGKQASSSSLEGPAAKGMLLDEATRPWLMLLSRTVLFAFFQTLIAGVFFLMGDVAPWTASTAWWPLSVVLANATCISLLIRLFQEEGKDYWSIFYIQRESLKGDLLYLLGFLVFAGPVGFLPNILVGNWLFGDQQKAMDLFIRPLPQWFVYTSMILFPITIALAELPTYFAYVKPRLEEQTGKPWLALSLSAFFLSAQHICMPLVFDARFVAWRLFMFMPFAFLVGWVLHKRPGTLPYLVVIHGLMDLATASMLLGVMV